MADKKTKIQPADDKADEQAVGAASKEEATQELPDYSAEQIAGMRPEEVAAYVGNAKRFIKSATQKSQDAAEVRKQSEQLRVESKYWKEQAEQMQANLQKVYEQMTKQPQQPVVSTPSQPPDYDPYNPEKWAKEYQKWHEDKLNANNSRYDELSKKFQALEDSTNVSVRTLRLEKYLEKAIPELGKDVSVEEIQIWVAQHPEADLSNMETLNQAIRERQAIYDKKVEEKYKEYVAEKEKAKEGAQDVPGSPFAGSTPDRDKFAKMTPTEREAIIGDGFNKFFNELEGGGG